MCKQLVGWILVLVVAAACTSTGDRVDAGSGSDQTTSLQGGTLRAAVPDFWVADVNLDPQRAYGGAGWELHRCCLLRTLYSYNGRPTEEGGAVPRSDLAAGTPEISPDGLTWTFRLREGLRYAPPFEDTPITALDVVRALERTARIRVLSPDVGYPFYYFPISGFEAYGSGAADSIVGLETPDDRTLVVRLSQVTNDLVYRFTLPATAPIPEGAADGHDEDYGGFLVSSGPYMVEGSEELDFASAPDQQQSAGGFVPPVFAEDGAAEAAGSLVLVRNPSWEPATDRLRAAYPDRIELTLGGSDDDIGRLVDAGELDLVLGPSSPFEQVARYRDAPASEDRLFVDTRNWSFAVSLNLAIPPFDDVHVRRAVAYAIDRGALVEMVSRPPHLPIGHSGEVATHIAPDAFEGGLLRAFDPYPYDPVSARAEMRASTYDRTHDGRCDAPVCRNVQTLVLDVGVIPDQARAIREDLAEVGIELALETRPLDGRGAFFETLHDPRGRIPMGIPYAWSQDFAEGTGWFPPLFHSTHIGRSNTSIGTSNTSLVGASPGQLRKWGYSISSVPSVDDRIHACVGRRGPAKTECWAELDQYLMTEVVSRIPYLLLEHAQVVSERVIRYSFDQFAELPALDRIALAPGSG